MEKCELRGNIIRNSKGKPGPIPRINARDKRLLIRTLMRMRKDNCNLTVMSLVKEAGLDPSLMHRRTYTKYLNSLGFYFLQARKKGLLSEKDKLARVRYARHMKAVLKRHPDFYSSHIAFYLDGVSFVHKYNPLKDACQTKSRVWRKPGEGLHITAKGSKDLAGGRRLHLIVAIAAGKGIILNEAYEKMNGEFFASFIRQYFNITFAKAGPKENQSRLFLMDNDPSQCSKKSMEALRAIEADLHFIPPRSPDLNPIENVFHLLKRRLQHQTIELKIEKESFEQFKERVLRCCEEIDISTIDKTIASLPKRIDGVLKKNGARTKY